MNKREFIDLISGIEKKDINQKAILCRQSLEKIISKIYEDNSFKHSKNASLLELLDNREILSFFDYNIELIDALHFVRIVGMNASVGKKIRPKDVKLAEDNMLCLFDYLEQKDIQKDCIFGTPKYMSEFETRRQYIDLYLQEAGWDVMTKKNVIQPQKAAIEIYVEGMPNKSEEGYCDYVLYGKDSRPLAIVEAKKTSVDPNKGRHQVDLYAECMEKIYGYKPILYYTNGYMLYVIDGIYPDRRVYNFHTIDELELMLQKRKRQAITDMSVNKEIASYPYQQMAITKTCERLNRNKRRALLVMATGTGKTRVSIAIVDVLSRNKWIKNVLFLADRTSLVSQAHSSYSEFLNQSMTILSEGKDIDFNARIMFSTYQTMINYIDAEEKVFSTGRFDLIILDEAHRSIFNKYGAIFKYFDSFVVGLTATPRGEIDKSTFKLLEYELNDEYFEYSMDEAIHDHYLVGYNVENKDSKFLREGIKYKDLSQEEKDQLDDYFENDSPNEDTVISKSELFTTLFNEDTCIRVLEALMKDGMRIDGGETLGKTIIFAYNHNHAQFIVDLFKKVYSEYSANYCQLIDNTVNYADDLIRKFKTDQEFRIAVSVDMLDTGVDVPSVLNLVFFKPVYSLIKFVQMIGRGTRLCKDLYGPGKDKVGFKIFDFYGNFEYFDKNPEGKFVEIRAVSLTQRLYSVRVEVLHELQQIQYQENDNYREYYNRLKDILYKEVLVIKSHSKRFAVRENMKYVDKYVDKSVWESLSVVNIKELQKYIVPLIDAGLNGNSNIVSFDLKMLKIELAILLDDNIARAEKEVKAVREIAQYLLQEKASIPAVFAKKEDLKTLVSTQFWIKPKPIEIEQIRESIRDLMAYLEKEKGKIFITDIEDDISDSDFVPTDTIIDIRSYKEKVIDYLVENIDNPTIQKIYNIEPIDSSDLQELERILWHDLGSEGDYKELTTQLNLAAFVRSLIGIDQEAVNEKFGKYLLGNVFNSHQQEFIKMIINYVRENGDIEVEDIVNTEPFDNYDLAELFGDNIPDVVSIINILHQSILAA